jgi:ribonucleotide monophosphatase NagD (HAD superfamily)
MATPDAATEFAGQETTTPGRAQAEGLALAAVVVGDSPEMMGHDELDAAFRQIRGGARLVAMHRGPWWLGEHGPTLDTGAYVAALEFATGRRAILGGKPATSFFRQACARLGLPADQVAMIGDDPRADISGARRAGLRTVLVSGGKTDPAELDGLHLRARPEALATGLREAVAALDLDA